jgi:hypothetical protein
MLQQILRSAILVWAEIRPQLRTEKNWLLVTGYWLLFIVVRVLVRYSILSINYQVRT